MTDGDLPNKAQSLVREWLQTNYAQLIEMWNTQIITDINTLDDFRILTTEHGLWKNARLDTSRTCVYWSDRVDLASDTILEYGRAC